MNTYNKIISLCFFGLVGIHCGSDESPPVEKPAAEKVTEKPAPNPATNVGMAADGKTPLLDIDPSAGIQSGSRLRARFLQVTDGPRLFLGWFDKQLKENCSFQRVGENSYLCLPLIIEIDKALESDTVGNYAGGSSPEEAIKTNYVQLRDWSNFSYCGARSLTSTLFKVKEIQAKESSQPVYVLGDAVTFDQFVGATATEEPVGNRFSRVHLQAKDGAAGYIAGLYDRTLKTPVVAASGCWLPGNVTEQTSIAPIESGYFSDGSCKTAVSLTRVSDLCLPSARPVFATEDYKTFFKISATKAAAVYDISGGNECIVPGGAGDYHALGPKADPTAFAYADHAFVGKGAKWKADFSAINGKVALEQGVAGNFYDTVRKQSCISDLSGETQTLKDGVQACFYGLKSPGKQLSPLAGARLAVNEADGATPRQQFFKDETCKSAIAIITAAAVGGQSAPLPSSTASPCGRPAEPAPVAKTASSGVLLFGQVTGLPSPAGSIPGLDGYELRPIPKGTPVYVQEGGQGCKAYGPFKDDKISYYEVGTAIDTYFDQGKIEFRTVVE